MDSDILYKITKQDFHKLDEILTKCFLNDPLYCRLIPKEEMRRKLLPELFECDLEEMFATCEIFSDSPDINSILVVSDESESYNHFRYYITEILASLKTNEYLIKEDPSLKTLFHFMEGKEYLNSSWTDELPETERIHIIYLAVAPEMQHHELAARLMREVIRYAEKKKLMISLETHNENNLGFYQHFGFQQYKVIDKRLGIKQYCFIRQ